MQPLKIFLIDKRLTLNGYSVVQLLYDAGVNVMAYMEELDQSDLILVPFSGRNRIPPEIHKKLSNMRVNMPVVGIEIEAEDIRNWPMATFDFQLPGNTHPLVFNHTLEMLVRGYRDKKKLLTLRSDYDRRMHEVNAMVEMGIEFTATLSRSDLYSAILNRTSSFIPAELYLLMIFDPEKPIADLRGHIGSPSRASPLPRTAHFSHETIEEILKLQGPVFDQNPFSRYPFLRNEVIRLEQIISSIMFVPIISKDKLLGFIDIINHTGAMGFTMNESERMEVLSDFAAVAMENAFLYEKTEMLAETDDLTGVQNFDFATRYIDRLTTVNDTFSMLFLDLDGFKQVNSRYGHLKGNEALRRVAEIIREVIRPSDLAARFGGDEFMIVMPGRDIKTARSISFELIRRIESERMFPDIKLSASIGIALFPDDGNTISSVIQKADMAMYEAKARGKGAVITYEEMTSKSEGDMLS